jgi:hypothetical protein
MDALVKPSDFDTLLDTYARGPEMLAEILAGIEDVHLDLALSDDTWTVRQIVHHVVDGDDLWNTCIKAALGGCGRADSSAVRSVFGLQWYWDRPQNEWAEAWAYARRAVEPSLALFKANRCHTAQLLREVPNACRGCIVVRWPSGQEQQVTVGWVVEMQTRHLSDHIEEIRSICRAHGVAGV